jgi:CRP-like cAMP-binding protein
MPQSQVPLAARVNRLLAALPPDDSEYLASAIRPERLPQGHVLGSRGKPATEIWFPVTSVIALSISDTDGRTVQTGLIGAEGCVGLETLFSQTPALASAEVQVSGDMAVIPSAHLRTVLASHPGIQATFSRFFYELSAYSLQNVACNRLHNLESRCCRWLLMVQDRTGSDDLPLTQQRLATMLGSGRSRINSLLAMLERDGLVQRDRGRIRLLTRPSLKRRACECYRLIPYAPNRFGDTEH